jgi:hypothetical protein
VPEQVTEAFGVAATATPAGSVNDVDVSPTAAGLFGLLIRMRSVDTLSYCTTESGLNRTELVNGDSDCTVKLCCAGEVLVTTLPSSPVTAPAGTVFIRSPTVVALTSKTIEHVPLTEVLGAAGITPFEKLICLLPGTAVSVPPQLFETTPTTLIPALVISSVKLTLLTGEPELSFDNVSVKAVVSPG